MVRSIRPVVELGASRIHLTAGPESQAVIPHHTPLGPEQCKQQANHLYNFGD
jgi:hypothetical protein